MAGTLEQAAITAEDRLVTFSRQKNRHPRPLVAEVLDEGGDVIAKFQINPITDKADRVA